MNPQARIAALEEILDQIIYTIEQVTQSGEELPDELQGMLAQEITDTIALINELRGEEGLPPEEDLIQTDEEIKNPASVPNGETPPPLDPAPYPSSNVNAFKFNPKTKELFVKYMGKDSANAGPTYKYSDVPQNIFDVILRGGVGPLSSGKNKYHAWHKGITPSHGASVSALIKNGGYQYQRLS